MPNTTFDPGDDICPPWWPQIIFDLHNWHWPKRWGPGNPVNYPPAIQDIMASLSIHTFSYLQLDQKAAQQVRTQAEHSIIETVKQLSQLHDKSIAQRKSPSA